MLVHGGGETGAAWDAVRRELRAPSIALDLLGRGRNPHDLGEVTNAAAVARAVADIRGATSRRIVLVAHSVAGALSGGMLEALAEQVVELVHVAALCPSENEMPLRLASRTYAERVLAEAADLRERFRGTSYAPAVGALPPPLRPMDDRAALVLLDLLNFGCTPGTPLPRTSSARRTFVRARRDRVYSPAAGERLAQAMRADEVVEVDASHDVPRSAPQTLARLLDERARLTARSASAVDER